MLWSSFGIYPGSPAVNSRRSKWEIACVQTRTLRFATWLLGQLAEPDGPAQRVAGFQGEIGCLKFQDQRYGTARALADCGIAGGPDGFG